MPGRWRAADRVALSGVAAALVLSGCAARGFVPPAGPGAPRPDADTVLAEAVAHCRDASTYAASTRLSGRVGDERLLPVTVLTGLTRDGQVRLEARALGSRVFVLFGSRDRATLWLREAERVLEAPAGAIVEALVGAPLSPERLLAVLTGCVSRDLTLQDAQGYGRIVAVRTPDGRLFLETRNRRWRVVAGAFDGFVVEYRVSEASFPREIHVRSEPDRRPAVRLTVEVGDHRVNDVLGPEAFTFAVPAGAVPMTLADLREAGPLRERPPGRAPAAFD